jgi:hypothetical protein
VNPGCPKELSSVRLRTALVPVLAVLLAGCGLSTSPETDSVAKAKEHGGAADSAEAEAFGEPVEGAPTLSFSAPVDTEFVVEKGGPVPAGRVNIRFRTTGAHNFALTGPGIPIALTWGLEAGAPVDITHSVELEPGTYRYVCSVPGHAQAGMKGTIEIT